MIACTLLVLHAYQHRHPHYMLSCTADIKHNVSHVPVHATPLLHGLLALSTVVCFI